MPPTKNAANASSGSASAAARDAVVNDESALAANTIGTRLYGGVAAIWAA
jgi:hypothetical protein